MKWYVISRWRNNENLKIEILTAAMILMHRSLQVRKKKDNKYELCSIIVYGEHIPDSEASADH
jgi:hypothetical protein